MAALHEPKDLLPLDPSFPPRLAASINPGPPPVTISAPLLASS